MFVHLLSQKSIIVSLGEVLEYTVSSLIIDLRGTQMALVNVL